MMRVPSAHREHKNSSELVMSKREGLDVGKYENTPHSDNGIQSPVSDNNIEWSSIVGYVAWIFRVSMTVITASHRMKGGIML